MVETGIYYSMYRSTISSAAFLIILGAIAKYGITTDIEGIDIEAIGTIFMYGGVFMLVIGTIMFLLAQNRSSREIRTYHDSDGTVSKSEVERIQH